MIRFWIRLLSTGFAVLFDLFLVECIIIYSDHGVVVIEMRLFVFLFLGVLTLVVGECLGFFLGIWVLSCCVARLG